MKEAKLTVGAIGLVLAALVPLRPVPLLSELAELLDAGVRAQDQLFCERARSRLDALNGVIRLVPAALLRPRRTALLCKVAALLDAGALAQEPLFFEQVRFRLDMLSSVAEQPSAGGKAPHCASG